MHDELFFLVFPLPPFTPHLPHSTITNEVTKPFLGKEEGGGGGRGVTHRMFENGY